MSDTESNSSETFNLNALLQEIVKLNAQSGVLSTVKIDDDKGTLAVVKPAVAHFVTEAKNYVMAKVKWDDPSTVKSAFKKLFNFLNAAEKQIGKDNLADLIEPIFDKVFADTAFHGYANSLASSKTPWRSILKEFRHILNIPSIDYSIEVYAKIDSYSPSSDTLLRLAIVQVISYIMEGNLQIDRLIAEADEQQDVPDDVSMRSGTSYAADNSEVPVNKRQLQALLIPSPVVIASKVVSWVPNALKPVLPVTLIDNNIRYSLDQLIMDLKDAINKIPAMTKVVSAQKNAKKEDKPKDNAAGNQQRPANNANPTVNNREQNAHQVQQNGRLGCLITHNAISCLGNCVSLEDELSDNDVHEVRLRVDTGADYDIFDARIIPFAERLGPAKGSFVTPLSSKLRKAELGRVTFKAVNVNGDEVTFARVGVLDFFGTSAVRPDEVTVSNGSGTIVVEGHVIPTLADGKHNAYVKFTPVASETSTKIKTVWDFARKMGFSIGDDTPSMPKIAKVIH